MMTFDEFWAGFDPYKTKGQELFRGHNYQTGKLIWEAATRAEREASANTVEGLVPRDSANWIVAKGFADAIRMRSNN